MNKFIAKSFSAIISILNLISILVYISSLIISVNIPNSFVIMIISTFAFVLYILFAGALTTFLSMNDNLIDINKNLNAIKRNLDRSDLEENIQEITRTMLKDRSSHQ